MKYRITPLNFASAFLVIAAAYVLFSGVRISNMPRYNHISGIITAVFLLFAFVVFVLDLMFRNFFHDTKKIWIIELSFITLTAIIFLLVK